MPTMIVYLDEQDRELRFPPTKGLHYATVHLDNFDFSDEEISASAQSLALLLLGAMQGAEVVNNDQSEKEVI